MTEYELHQLIFASRAEFDIATVVMLVASLGFIYIAGRSLKGWDAVTRKLFLFSYMVVSLLVFLRTIASIVRFGKLNLILQAGEPEFLVTNVLLQVPTALLRIGFFIILFILTIRMIKKHS
jgi:hypothetical protein